MWPAVPTTAVTVMHQRASTVTLHTSATRPPGYLTVGEGDDLHMTLEKPTVRWYIGNTDSFRLSHNGLYKIAGEPELGTDGDNILIDITSELWSAWYFSGGYIVSSMNDYILVDYSSFDIVKLMVQRKSEVYEDQKWIFTDCAY
ncbi:hypothetical protein SARC_08477 [Sphaeroforma arctica JP610]|uniref:Uncharacterized protein n=1 Tax=Sphaeroforma arctica JP610 TaxID=667725 RepID=A0A0L0FQS4_9EUKA|nr:hypothetical protein SARC_08477 [Sphaeroforma arctica JP610]KNC79110.1 hypothetical protein SARC_08477 [Sphaeroforma arctica JP610]|eukprot:XP_014153012.1 hypothetical protein SARC_08477 [Sphaeroforma arctica JP610]